MKKIAFKSHELNVGQCCSCLQIPDSEMPKPQRQLSLPACNLSLIYLVWVKNHSSCSELCPKMVILLFTNDNIGSPHFYHWEFCWDINTLYFFEKDRNRTLVFCLCSVKPVALRHCQPLKVVKSFDRIQA